MTARRIAIVEDDPAQSDLLVHVATAAGHVAVPFVSGEAFLKALQRDTFDLLVVDWHLPGIHGPGVVAGVRAQGQTCPILFVTSRAQEADIVAGLQAGADDYVAKPVRPAELAARLQALLRRAYPEPAAERHAFGPYLFDLTRRVASVDGVPVDLQPREFDLAVYLFNNLGRLLSRAHLAESVLRASPEAISRSLDTHVSRVRTKLGIGPASGYRLASVYGLGYRLDEVET